MQGQLFNAAARPQHDFHSHCCAGYTAAEGAVDVGAVVAGMQKGEVKQQA